MSQYTSNLAKFITKAICNVINDGIVALMKEILKDLSEAERRALACTMGYLLGAYENRTLKPREFECIDFERIFNLTDENIECDIDPKRLEMWELKILPKLIDLLGPEAIKALTNVIMEEIERDPARIYNLVVEHLGSSPILECYKLDVGDDVLEIRLCYKSPKAAEALSETPTGGFIINILANAAARLRGRMVAKLSGISLEDERRVNIRFVFARCRFYFLERG